MTGITTTIIGNLGKDVELKFAKNGMAVATFNIGHTPSTFRDGVWENGETIWVRVVTFKEKAEAVADQLKKGDSVLVLGKLKQSSYTDKEGNARTSLEITADEVALVIKSAPRARNTQEDSAPW